MICYVNMTETLERLAAEAINASICSVSRLADMAGLHKVTLTRWRTKETGVSATSAVKLAAAIESKATRMLQLAAGLRAQALLEQREEER